MARLSVASRLLLLPCQHAARSARFMSTGQSSKLFVGGLSWQIEEDVLKDAFSSFGEVTEAKIVMDPETNRSKGFGFVNFASNKHADNAIKVMDGKQLGGRTLRVNYAIDKPRGLGYGGGYDEN